MTAPDPFQFKSLSKFHPTRVFFTLVARLREKWSNLRFHCYELDRKVPFPLQNTDVAFEGEDTSVTSEQMQVLLECIEITETNPAPAVEIGAYRGVTSALLAQHTKRGYLIVDPYAGYGGAESDLQKMQERISKLPNVTHHRMTSGEAARSGDIKTISFAFVDAVHDYVNVIFDGTIWARKLVPGGLIAFHDTDSRIFSGARAAVWKLIHDSTSGLELFAHVEGLVVLRKCESAQ